MYKLVSQAWWYISISVQVGTLYLLTRCTTETFIVPAVLPGISSRFKDLPLHLVVVINNLVVTWFQTHVSICYLYHVKTWVWNQVTHTCMMGTKKLIEYLNTYIIIWYTNIPRLNQTQIFIAINVFFDAGIVSANLTSRQVLVS